MRPDEPSRRTSRPYDVAAEDLTDEFWGRDRSGEQMRPSRSHDVPVTAWSHHRADPSKVRAGIFVLGMLLMVPIVLAARPDRSMPFAVGPVVEAAGVEAPVGAVIEMSAGVLVESTATTPSSAAAPTDVEPTVPTSIADSTAVESVTTITTIMTTPSDPPAGTAAGRQTTAAAPSGASLDGGADVQAPARRVVPSCPQTYTAGAGDSWYRIADEAGISVDDLLDENNATLLAVIHPGDSICLPSDAVIPSPPPTTTLPPSTTTPPTTTSPPTTTVPSANLSPQQVQDLIRQTWPADEVDKALAVAWRESNYIATADNGWCCVGVFQIYWTVHRSWLGQFGIHERDDLKDARKNIAAAYHLWQSQGWGPWGG